jgi:hypothetical protein
LENYSALNNVALLNFDNEEAFEGYSRNVPDEGYSRNVPDECLREENLSFINTYII